MTSHGIALQTDMKRSTVHLQGMVWIADKKGALCQGGLQVHICKS